MLELINAERASVGAGALQLELNLNQAAEDHSEWMIATDIFSHTGVGGSSPGTRMANAGFDFGTSYGWAENIAGRTIRLPDGFSDEVEGLHAQLMNSTGHRENLLNASYDYIGIGIEIGEFEGATWAFVTQKFARTNGDVDLDTGSGGSDPIVTTNTKTLGDGRVKVTEFVDGVRRSVTTTDEGDAYSWTSLIKLYDEAGSLVSKSQFFDNGKSTEIAYDNGSITQKIVTEADGDKATTTYDAGLRDEFVFEDVSDTRSWASYTNKYDGSGALVSKTFVFESGKLVLHGHNGADDLFGDNGNDVLKGKGGNDRLFGGNGKDKLWGDGGSDELHGGAGDDIFMFDASSGQDIIADFGSGDVMRILSGAEQMSDLAFTEISGGLLVEFASVDIFLVGLDLGDVNSSDFDFV